MATRRRASFRSTCGHSTSISTAAADSSGFWAAPGWHFCTPGPTCCPRSGPGQPDGSRTSGSSTSIPERWSCTPLEWALHGWSDPPEEHEADRYYEVVALLVGAGVPVKPEWLEGAKVVGVTAGASAPEELVIRVLEHLGAMGATEFEEQPGEDENVHFALPQELLHPEKLMA